MLNPFPSLLDFAYFGPTLLRLAAGLALVYVAYRLWQERAAIEHAKLPVIGHAAQWMIFCSAALTGLIALGLILGFWTQVAAILGALVCLKHLMLKRHYDALLPLSRGAYVLILIICVSLIFTGAGAIAFDLPL